MTVNMGEDERDRDTLIEMEEMLEALRDAQERAPGVAKPTVYRFGAAARQRAAFNLRAVLSDGFKPIECGEEEDYEEEQVPEPIDEEALERERQKKRSVFERAVRLGEQVLAKTQQKTFAKANRLGDKALIQSKKQAQQARRLEKEHAYENALKERQAIIARTREMEKLKQDLEMWKRIRRELA